MKKILIILSLLSSVAVMAQKPKIYTGVQTTYNNLTRYGSGAPTFNPSGSVYDTLAYSYIDTSQNTHPITYEWAKTKWFVTSQLRQPSPPLPVATVPNPDIDNTMAVWVDTDDGDNKYYYDQAQAAWKPIGEYLSASAPNDIAATGSTGAVNYRRALWLDSAVSRLKAWNGTAWVDVTAGDNWGTQVTSVNARLTGNGTSGSPLDLGFSGVTPGSFTLMNATVDVYGRITTASNGTVNLSSQVTSTLLSNFGGTGLNTYAVGDMLFYSSGTALSRLAIGTAGQLLRVNAGGTAPEWWTPNFLTANQTITLTGAVTGSGTTSITTTLSALGATSSGQVLTWNGSAWAAAAPSGSITGSGTTNYLAKWTSSSGLGTSLFFDNGTLASVGGNTLIGRFTVQRTSGKEISFDDNEIVFRGAGIANFSLKVNRNGVNGLFIDDISSTGNHNDLTGTQMWKIYKASGTPTAETFGRNKSQFLTVTNGAIANGSLVSDASGNFTFQSLWYNSGGVTTQQNVVIGSTSGNQLLIFNNYASTSQASAGTFSAIKLANKDVTNNNWTAIEWSANNNAGIAASLAAQFTNHISLYADLVISTRAADGYNTRAKFISTGIQTLDGSASTPGFSFVNDGDVGMWRPTTNVLAFSTGGVERLRLGASGEVYFNTSAGTSGQILQSNGTASAPTWVTSPLLGSTGTTNTIAKWTGSNTLGNSLLSESGTIVTVAGQIKSNVASGSFSYESDNSSQAGFWRFGEAWAGNYDNVFGFAWNGNAIVASISTTGLITAFGGYQMNVPASSTRLLSPLQHTNSYLSFTAPASGIPGNNVRLQSWDELRLDALTGVIRFSVGNIEEMRVDANGLLIGTAGSMTGMLRLAGATSGTVTLTTNAAAGTWTFTLPNTAGTNGQFLQTNGSGVTSWQTISGLLPSGTNGQTLRHNGTSWIASSAITNTGTNVDVLPTTQWSLFVGGQGLYGVSNAITAQTADFIIINPLAAGLPAAGLQLYEDNDNTTPQSVRITTPTITANYNQTLTPASGEIGAWLRTVPVAFDFPSTGANSFSELAVTLTGSVVGKPCIVGYSTNVQGEFSAYCATAGTITVRYSNTSLVTIDPASTTIEVHQKL